MLCQYKTFTLSTYITTKCTCVYLIVSLLGLFFGFVIACAWGLFCSKYAGFWFYMMRNEQYRMDRGCSITNNICKL